MKYIYITLILVIMVLVGKLKYDIWRGSRLCDSFDWQKELREKEGISCKFFISVGDYRARKNIKYNNSLHY